MSGYERIGHSECPGLEGYTVCNELGMEQIQVEREGNVFLFWCYTRRNVE